MTYFNLKEITGRLGDNEPREIKRIGRRIIGEFEKKGNVTPILSFRREHRDPILDPKFIWDVTLSERIKLLEQESDRYVVRQRRTQTMEWYQEAYAVLNAIKRDNQRVYGTDLLDYDLYLFDHIKGVPIDSPRISNPKFFEGVVREYGAALARCFALGVRGLDTIGYTAVSGHNDYYNRVILNEKDLPIEVRLSEFPIVTYHIDLEKAVESFSEAYLYLDLLGAREGGKGKDVDTKKILLDGFLTEYERIKQLWGPNIESILRQKQEDFFRAKDLYLYLVNFDPSKPNENIRSAFGQCSESLTSFPIDKFKNRVEKDIL